MKAKISLGLFTLILTFFSIACTKGPSDEQIASQVQSKITADANISSKQVNAQSAGGVVTLSGTVASEMERTSAANDAATVPGVKTVINNLQIQPESAQAVAPPEPTTAAPAVPAARRESAARPRATRATSSAVAPDRTVMTQPASTPPPTVAETAAPPPAPPKPVTVTVPEGTEIAIRLADPLDSEKSQTGDTFRATLAQSVLVGGKVAFPVGSDVEGRVVEAKNAAHFSGSSSLTLELTRLSVNGETYELRTDQWSKQGAARGKNTATKVGAGAAIGAIIGGIAGGGKGAAIGAGAGAAAGTGVQAATRGQQVRLATEEMLTFHLENSLTVTPTTQRSRE